MEDDEGSGGDSQALAIKLERVRGKLRDFSDRNLAVDKEVQPSRETKKKQRRPLQTKRQRPSKSAPQLQQTDWLIIKDLYCAGDRTIDQICRENGVTKSQLYNRRRKEAWPARKAEKAKSHLNSDGVAHNRRKSDLHNRRKGDKLISAGEGDKGRHTSALLDRLYSAFNQQIGELESRFSEPIKHNGEEEKTARTLGTLARTLGKLVELQREADAHSQDRGDDAADVERLHRELAQRIDRLRRQRDPEYSTGGA